MQGKELKLEEVEASHTLPCLHCFNMPSCSLPTMFFIICLDTLQRPFPRTSLDQSAHTLLMTFLPSASDDGLSSR